MSPQRARVWESAKFSLYCKIHRASSKSSIKQGTKFGGLDIRGKTYYTEKNHA
jgi:hypothetical protein